MKEQTSEIKVLNKFACILLIPLYDNTVISAQQLQINDTYLPILKIVFWLQNQQNVKA